MKKKILYFQHVPWSWIKQRPQFLAEGLSEYYDVTVVNTIILGSKRGHSESNVHFVNIYRLPYERFYIIAIVNSVLRWLQLFLVKGHYDIVWLALPSFIRDAKRFIKNSILVYDCMDDHLAFNNNAKRNKIIYEYEEMTCKRADIVLASSNYLKNKLVERYGSRDVNVVYNAVSDTLLCKVNTINLTIKEMFDSEYYNISYIGTIAEWFDFDLIKAALDNNKKIRFHLFGPALVNIPKINGLSYHGCVSHNDVPTVMKSSNALIMPFVVTELIRSVNPVKLYEYIVSGKPCFAPEYGESMQFSEFVMLYKDHQHFLNLLEDAMEKDVVRSEDDRMSFISSNTWNNRIESVKKILG